MTVKEVLVNSGLDFDILKMPLVAKSDSGDDIITPYFGLVNSKTKETVNTTKGGYTVSQNKDVIEMVFKGVKKFGDDISITKAGSINGGRRVYVQLKLAGKAKIGGDTVDQYITVIDSNDGSTGLSVGIGDEFMHCHNQFYKFYKAGNSIYRHTATIENKIKEIPNLIETALSESLKQVRTYEKFASTPLTRHLADKMVKHVLGYDRKFTSKAEQNELTTRSLNMMDSLYDAITIEQKYMGNNLLALFNGVTRYTTHIQKPAKRENGDMESLLVGSGYKKAASAYEFCLTV